MKFSKLRLIGFKSFVDPIEMNILPGLTGVVGPNGCGKSNLLEALRWVMGENRPSSMRGGGMEDVIFAGAGTRPAKNYAEVTLVLEDVDKNRVDALNGQNIKSIDVVRRVTRDIGSSFRLDGKDVRARDVQIMFADSSTGAHSPSLVRQGQVSELINANPKSRRAILEEAAGISGLYQRRHEAELKLKASETNLERVDDILQQLLVQVKTLEKQARQAAHYKEIGEKIRHNESLLLFNRWFELDKNFQATSNEKNQLNLMTARLQHSLNQLKNSRETIENVLPELRKKETESSAKLQRVLLEIDRIDQEEERSHSSISDLKKRITEVEHDYTRQQNLDGDAKTVIQQLNREQIQLKKLSDCHDKKIIEAKRSKDIATSKSIAAESDFEETSEKFAQISAELKSSGARISKAKDSILFLENTIAHEKQKTIQLQEDLKLKKERLLAERKKIGLIEKASVAADKEIKVISCVRDEARNLEEKSRLAYSTLEGKLAALKEEESSLKLLVEEQDNSAVQVFDKVFVEKGYEAALGAAMEDDLAFPLILSNNSSGWFELPSIVEILDLPKGVRSLSDKVNAPKALSRKLQYVGLVESSDGPKLQSLLAPGQRLVSKNGDMWRWDGFCSMAGESLPKAAITLKRKNRLKVVNDEIGKTTKELEALEIDLNKVQGKLKDAETEHDQLRESIKKLDGQLSDSFQDYNAQERDVSRCEDKLSSIARGIGFRKRELVELNREIKVSEDKKNNVDEVEQLKEKLEGLRSQLAILRNEMVEKSANYEQVNREEVIRSEREKQINSELSVWQDRLQLASETISDLENRRQALKLELDNTEKNPSVFAETREKLNLILLGVEKEKESRTEELASKESELSQAKLLEKEEERKASDLREKNARLEAIIDGAQNNLENLGKSIEEKLKTKVEDFVSSMAAKKDNLSVNVDELESEVQRLKLRREALGAVNLRAEQDTKEILEEQKNLTRDKLDLENAIKKLRLGISKLNGEGRSRLLNAFTSVNKNFEQLFITLFGGGTARLELVESDDPLNAGLEIMCQPPGKKLSNLSLLSGGEQTLTALSLIFAVFKTNPSPICVLDEVDAPLDEANVERFCELLDQMRKSTDTRFIIITHHPLSMSRMDRLYGVTMVERGVSQLVTVDLEKAEEMLEM